MVLENHNRPQEQVEEDKQLVVADAYFSYKIFADGLIAEEFNLVSRFRSNAKLRYLYSREPNCKKDRPKKYDGDIDLRNPDFSRMTVFEVPEVEEKGKFYYLKANSRALKRDVALVIWIKTDG